MTEDTFRFTTNITIASWLEMSESVMSIYRARPGHINDSLAKELGKKIQTVRTIQESCRLFNVTANIDQPLYHYELSGPTLTQLRILCPDFVARLKKNTEHYLA